MKIGFVGLGLMGRPMAGRLIEAGHEVHVFSTSADAVGALADRGAAAGESVADVAGRVEIFCSCRVTPDQSRAVFTGAGGVLSAAPVPPLCIDFATIDPMASREIGRALGSAGADYIDAPVSGGPHAAAAGTLTIIAGGEAAAVARAGPLFDILGKRTFHMGGTGAGVAAKLCNNLITITSHALIAEAMVLGARAGIDGHALYEVLSQSSAYSRTLERVVPGHFLPRNFEAAASMKTIMKDLQGALDLAAAEGIRSALGETAMTLFAEAAARGHAGDDIAAVILPMERAAGVRVGSAE